MNYKVKFIEAAHLKANTTISENVDEDILVPYIYKAQDTHLQQVLGSSFYNHLKDGVKNKTLTPDEKTLIYDFIQGMVTEWSLYEVLPFISFKLTNKSVSKERSEWSDHSDLNDIKFLRTVIRDMAEFYTKRLVTFLNQNCKMFPEYENPDRPENLRRSGDAYFSGIFISKKR